MQKTPCFGSHRFKEFFCFIQDPYRSHDAWFSLFLHKLFGILIKKQNFQKKFLIWTKVVRFNLYNRFHNRKNCDFYKKVFNPDTNCQG